VVTRLGLEGIVAKRKRSSYTPGGSSAWIKARNQRTDDFVIVGWVANRNNPDGIHGKSFYQKDAPDFVPDWIHREVLWSEGTEREIRYFAVHSAAATARSTSTICKTATVGCWWHRLACEQRPALPPRQRSPTNATPQARSSERSVERLTRHGSCAVAAGGNRQQPITAGLGWRLTLHEAVGGH
jgi:hypothetical protein